MGIARASPDSAHLGYYNINLANNVNAEFTAGSKSAMIKYTVNDSEIDKNF